VDAVKLKIGDIVVHRTGGPRMIVERISAFGGVARCSFWSVTDDAFHEYEFPVECLRRAA
jgi:uncharacterized protein YodC (DUF2158 family)